MAANGGPPCCRCEAPQRESHAWYDPDGTMVDGFAAVEDPTFLCLECTRKHANASLAFLASRANRETLSRGRAEGAIMGRLMVGLVTDVVGRSPLPRGWLKRKFAEKESMMERGMHPEIATGLGAAVLVGVFAAALGNEWLAHPVSGALAIWLMAGTIGAGFAASAWLALEVRHVDRCDHDSNDQQEARALPDQLNEARQAERRLPAAR